MRFRQIRLLSVLGALIAVAGCDGGAVVQAPPAPPAPSGGLGPLGSTVYTLRAIVSPGGERPLPTDGCSPGPEGWVGAVRATGGVLRIDGDRFAVSIAVTGTAVTDPIFPQDTLRASGTFERYGPLLLLRTTDGDTLFAAVGPDPAAPSTVTLADAGGRLLMQGRLPGVHVDGTCALWRFAAAGFEPDPAVRGVAGRSDRLTLVAIGTHQWGEWAALPFRRGVVQTRPTGTLALTYRTGSLVLEPAGYTFALEWDAEGAVIVSSVSGGYVAAGPVVLLDAGLPSATFGAVGGGGLVLYQNGLRLQVNTWPNWLAARPLRLAAGTD